MRLLLLPLLLFATSCREKDAPPAGDDTEDTSQVDTEATDADGDGSPANADCNDNDDGIYPGAPEHCDGLDNDCDDEVDENAIDATSFYGDSDGDGYGGDTFVVEACEAPQGFVADADDCNDLDSSSHPDADEVCDGADNDCDGFLDESDAVDAATWYHDTDGDGFGVTTDTETACDAPRDHVSHDGDCDDTDPAFHPGALEADCTDPNDYNCDGSVGFADADGDGYAACDDCDDAEATANPDGSETCDGLDNDCDGTVDDDASDALTWYADADGDGHGGAQFSVVECAAPAGYVASQDDCDDLDAASYPGASEVCDDADNDCDTEVDEGVGTPWYADSDSDGYGNGSVSAISCDMPSGYVGNALDCDDFNAATNPGSYEICDGADNDCDGISDEDAINATDWYVDGDGDGYGASGSSTSACDQPTGYASNDADCNDADAGVSPGATETCDQVDNDCDGTVDDNAVDSQTFYEDADGDSYGNALSTIVACSSPSGFVSDATDCDDTNSSAYPSGTEVCDTADNDCDGTIDEDDATDASTWYEDADGDGYGNSSVSSQACTAPASSVANATDCNDSDTGVNPGVTETWYDGVDADCAGDNDNDADGDGAESYQNASGTDCDDSDSSVTACGGSANTAVTSCSELLSIDSSLGDGVYWIDPDGQGAFETLCEMTSNGGGWTLVMTLVDDDRQLSDWDANNMWNYPGENRWADQSVFGSLTTSTTAQTGDYKNRAYWALSASNVFMAHVPNGTAVASALSNALYAYHTTDGFLSSYGSSLYQLYTSHYAMESVGSRYIGLRVDVTFTVGSASGLHGRQHVNSRNETEAGGITFTVSNQEGTRAALCPVKYRTNSFNTEHSCVGGLGSTQGRGQGGWGNLNEWHYSSDWGLDSTMRSSTWMIFVR